MPGVCYMYECHWLQGMWFSHKCRDLGGGVRGGGGEGGEGGLGRYIGTYASRFHIGILQYHECH